MNWQEICAAVIEIVETGLCLFPWKCYYSSAVATRLRVADCYAIPSLPALVLNAGKRHSETMLATFELGHSLFVSTAGGDYYTDGSSLSWAVGSLDSESDTQHGLKQAYERFP